MHHGLGSCNQQHEHASRIIEGMCTALLMCKGWVLAGIHGFVITGKHLTMQY